MKEQCLYGHSTMVCLIWKGDDIIGYTHTYKEADEICNKNTELVWDYNKPNKRKPYILSEVELKEIPFITIHSIIK